MNDLKKNIIYREIDKSVAMGSTSLFSPIMGATVFLGTTSYFAHLKKSSKGERCIDDILKRHNLSKKAPDILTGSSSINIGSTSGFHYKFDTIADPTDKIRITLRDGEVYSIRAN